MNQQGKKPGYGNGGKTNCVFPPFPQPILLLTNQNEKVADQKQQTIDYTKSLTLPPTSALCAENFHCLDHLANDRLRVA